MECPICSSLLKRIKYKSIVLDQCPGCKGVWFDSGELLDFAWTIKEQVEAIDREAPDKMPQIRSTYSVQEKEKSCPKCQKKLVRFNYSYDSNIFLDKCLGCDGVWADGGEVKQIAKYLRSIPKAKAVKRKFRRDMTANKNVTLSPELDKEVKKIAAMRKGDPRIKAINAEQAKINQKIQYLKDIKQAGDLLRKRVSPACYFLPIFAFPIGDENPRERFPLVTVAIITLCVVIFTLQLIYVDDVGPFFKKYGQIPADFFSIGLISSIFLHGGFEHILGNMLFLWVFGDNVEDRFTKGAFLVFYLLCGLSASILHTIANIGSTVPCIGASGAISGVMGAYVVFYPRAKVKLFILFKTIHLPVYIYLGVWILYQIYMGLIHRIPTTITGVGGGVAWFAHIGGFLFGVLIAFLIVFWSNKQVNKQIELNGKRWSC